MNSTIGQVFMLSSKKIKNKKSLSVHAKYNFKIQEGKNKLWTVADTFALPPHNIL